MTITIKGIDTTNDDLINQYVNAVIQNIPNYNGINVNVIDSTTLEIDLG